MRHVEAVPKVVQGRNLVPKKLPPQAQASGPRLVVPIAGGIANDCGKCLPELEESKRGDGLNFFVCGPRLHQRRQFLAESKVLQGLPKTRIVS